jgi:hypothetical protein
MTGLQVEVSHLSAKIVKEIEEVLQRNGAAAANVTPEGLYQTMERVMDRYMATKAPLMAQAAVIEQVSTKPKYELKSWGGGLHVLPEGYKLPEVSVATGFRLWHLGNESEKLPPFRTFAPTDFSIKKERKAFSDWKYMMKTLGDVLGEDDMVTEQNDLTIDIVSSQYKLAHQKLPVINKKKRCRPEEWAIPTAVRETRAAFKRQRIINLPEGSDSDAQ